MLGGLTEIFSARRRISSRLNLHAARLAVGDLTATSGQTTYVLLIRCRTRVLALSLNQFIVRIAIDL